MRKCQKMAWLSEFTTDYVAGGGGEEGKKENFLAI
jgi:hypothetical protein